MLLFNQSWRIVIIQQEYTTKLSNLINSKTNQREEPFFTSHNYKTKQQKLKP